VDPAVEAVTAYHERTKHRFDRYARSLGYLDWAAQPNPFRRFEGAPLYRLELPDGDERPTYDSLFEALPPPAPAGRSFLGRLFYYSLALSAWKEVRGPRGEVRARWSLRVDPSSGNLHPTEAYLVGGPLEGLSKSPAVFHYAPFEHALELRRVLEAPPAGLYLGLTSIHWREAWKYGERAFRYCQHDVGHCIGAIALAAAALGWRARLCDEVGTRELAALLGVDRQAGDEAEHADCLLALEPAGDAAPAARVSLEGIAGGEWLGVPNRLSACHHSWPVIDEMSRAAGSPGLRHPAFELPAGGYPLAERGLPAHRIIRRRRSAVAMDGETEMDRDAFYRLLIRLLPRAGVVPFSALGWRPAVSLLLFVHRVSGLAPGLYALVRHPAHHESLRAALRAEFLWEKPEGGPEGLPLFLLLPGDLRDVARQVSCHQEIASDGVFAAGMLAGFAGALESGGPAMYPRLFWETGVVGQMLYLEAEAAGLRGTGIGCFFDDAVHELAGIRDRAWQSLYHFTVGGPVDDPRLGDAGAYDHLRLRELHGEDAWPEA
jgi:SagB-type dehydrogenase family enzyme